jgi:ferredoxin-NADP reductase
MPVPKARAGGVVAPAGPRSDFLGAQNSSSSDPELDLLLGAIRRRRADQLARERLLHPATASSPPVRRAALPPPAVRSAAAAAAAAVLASPSAAAKNPAAARRASSPGALLEVQAIGPSVRIFRVARPRDFVFKAGQSVKLGLEPTSVRRRYSIASAPHEPHLEFCVERVPGGRFSSRLFELAVGDAVSLAGAAKGDFSLRADKRQHVMVATGTGIAPLRSMLRDALEQAPAAEREFWILHGASHADELPYADELAALSRGDRRVHYLPTVSRPGNLRNRAWVGQHGRVDALVLPTLRALSSKGDVAVYACGHLEMVRAVREQLAPLGYLVLDEAFD